MELGDRAGLPPSVSKGSWLPQLKREVRAGILRLVVNIFHGLALASYLLIAAGIEALRRRLQVGPIESIVFYVWEASFGYVFLNRLCVEIRLGKQVRSKRGKRQR